MSEVIFPEGIFVKEPHEKAPDFVKGRLSIKKSALLAWLEGRDEWTNLDIKRSKGNTLYLQVDTWVKPPVAEGSDSQGGDGDGLPF